MACFFSLPPRHCLCHPTPARRWPTGMARPSHVAGVLPTTMEALSVRLDALFAPLRTLLEPLTVHVRPTHAPLWEGEVFGFHATFYPSQHYVQAFLVGLALVYYFASRVGRWRNQQIVQPFVKVVTPALEGEFAQVSTGEGITHPLVWNGADSAMLFATGRRGVETLHATITLKPRHDPLKLGGSFLYDVLALPTTPVQAEDHVTFQLALPKRSRAVGTFAVIDKMVLQRVRHGRYDLSFAKISDAANASTQRKLDNRFAIASESNDITDRFLGEADARGDAQRGRIGLVDALNGPGGRFVESLVWTDQPTTAPTDAVVSYAERLSLTLRLPRTERDAQACLPVLGALWDVVDALHGTAMGRTNLMALRPETQAGLKKTRTEIEMVLRQDQNKLSKEDEKEALEDARRKAQQEKLAKMSPAEQAKRRQLEKKRAQRKAAQAASGKR